MKKCIKKLLCIVMAVALLSSLTITANAIWSVEDLIDWSCQKTTLRVEYDKDGTPTYKSEAKYNDQGLGIEETDYSYDTEKSEFVPSYKYVYEYGANKMDCNTKAYRWVTDKNDWVLETTSENKYNENGDNILSQYMGYDADGKVTYGGKYETVYNSNGDQEFYVSENYKPDLEKWEFSFGTRYVYEYDANGNKISRISKDLSSREDEGALSSKSEYTYTGDNLTQVIYYDFGGADFVPSSKEENAYDANGNLISNLHYYYDTDAAAFKENNKSVYEYDASGNQTMYESFIFQGDEWVSDTKYITVYNEAGKEILEESYNGGNKGTKYEMAYDASGRVIGMTSYDGENNEWVNTYKQEVKYDDAKNEYTINSYDWDGSQWTNDGSTVYTTVVIHEKLEKISGQAPTTEAAGWKDYYKCVECGKYFEDEKGTVEITDLAKWKAEGGNGYIAKLEVATTQEKSPKTGDNAVLLECLVSVALAGFVLCSLSRKKA